MFLFFYGHILEINPVVCFMFYYIRNRRQCYNYKYDLQILRLEHILGVTFLFIRSLQYN